MPESIKSGARTIRQAALIVVPVISLFIILFADLEPGKPQVTYTFAIAYSASIGGISTLVGTPPNLSFARIVNIIFPEMTEISFADWFIFAVPVTILLFGAAWLLLYLMYRPKKSWKGLQMDDFRSEYNSLGKAKPEEKTVLVLFSILALLWIFRSGFEIQSFNVPGWSQLFNNPSYINDGTVAIFMALLLFIIPSKTQKGERIMNWKTANKIPWGIVLLFGGGFALAQGFVESGLSVWFGEQLSGLASVDPIVLTLANVSIMSLLTELNKVEELITQYPEINDEANTYFLNELSPDVKWRKYYQYRKTVLNSLPIETLVEKINEIFISKYSY